MKDKLTGKVKMLRSIMKELGIDNLKAEFFKLQAKEMAKWVRKKKFDKIEKEKHSWLDSPSFMEFWTKELGLTKDHIDQLFKYEVAK